MEVIVAENKTQKGKGKVGSQENPETYANVPGHIIPIIEREFEDFDNEAEKFLADELPEAEFIGFRLKQGVYGQRQPDVQIVVDRVEIIRPVQGDDPQRPIGTNVDFSWHVVHVRLPIPRFAKR